MFLPVAESRLPGIAGAETRCSSSLDAAPDERLIRKKSGGGLGGGRADRGASITMAPDRNRPGTQGSGNERF